MIRKIKKPDNCASMSIRHWRAVGDALYPYSRKEKWVDPESNPGDVEPDPRGGLTTCTMISTEGVVFFGSASCSVKDTFSYRIGSQIAYGRALKQWHGY